MSSRLGLWFKDRLNRPTVNLDFINPEYVELNPKASGYTLTQAPSTSNGIQSYFHAPTGLAEDRSDVLSLGSEIELPYREQSFDYSAIDMESMRSDDSMMNSGHGSARKRSVRFGEDRKIHSSNARGNSLPPVKSILKSNVPRPVVRHAPDIAPRDAMTARFPQPVSITHAEEPPRASKTAHLRSFSNFINRRNRPSSMYVGTPPHLVDAALRSGPTHQADIENFLLPRLDVSSDGLTPFDRRASRKTCVPIKRTFKVSSESLSPRVVVSARAPRSPRHQSHNVNNSNHFVTRKKNSHYQRESYLLNDLYDDLPADEAQTMRELSGNGLFYERVRRLRDMGEDPFNEKNKSFLSPEILLKSQFRDETTSIRDTRKKTSPLDADLLKWSKLAPTRDELKQKRSNAEYSKLKERMDEAKLRDKHSRTPLDPMNPRRPYEVPHTKSGRLEPIVPGYIPLPAEVGSRRRKKSKDRGIKLDSVRKESTLPQYSGIRGNEYDPFAFYHTPKGPAREFGAQVLIPNSRPSLPDPYVPLGACPCAAYHAGPAPHGTMHSTAIPALVPDSVAPPAMRGTVHDTMTRSPPDDPIKTRSNDVTSGTTRPTSASLTVQSNPKSNVSPSVSSNASSDPRHSARKVGFANVLERITVSSESYATTTAPSSTSSVPVAKKAVTMPPPKAAPKIDTTNKVTGKTTTKNPNTTKANKPEPKKTTTVNKAEPKKPSPVADKKESKKAAGMSPSASENKAKLGNLFAKLGGPPGSKTSKTTAVADKSEPNKSAGLSPSASENKAKLGNLFAKLGGPPGSKAPKTSNDTGSTGSKSLSVGKKAVLNPPQKKKSADSLEGPKFLAKATTKAKTLMRRVSMTANIDTVNDFKNLSEIRKAALVNAMAKDDICWGDLGMGSDESIEKAVNDLKGDGMMDPKKLQNNVKQARRRGSFLAADDESENKKKVEKALGADVVAKQSKMVSPLMAELNRPGMKAMFKRRATMADSHAVFGKSKNVG